MPDLLATFKQLFRGINPNKPANIAEIANVRASVDSRVTDGLSPERLASILRSAKENQIIQYLELAEAMEERDLHYYSLLQTRKLAITGASWVVESDDDEITEALEREVIKQPAFQWLIGDLMDAVGKGFAVAQPVWDTDSPRAQATKRWQYKSFTRVDPRCFQFDKQTMQELRLRSVVEGGDGLVLPPDLIVHYPRLRAGVPIRGGLAMLAAVTWMFKNFTVKDWMAFTEVYGMPLKIAKYQSQAMTPDDRASLRRALSNVGHDAALLIPDTVELEIENGRTGTSPYLELAEYFDKQLSKGVLGQTMTSDDGASLAQSKVHEGVRHDISQADAFNIGASAVDQVFSPWGRLNFGEERWQAANVVAYPDTSPPEDVKSWSDAVVPLIQAGLKVPAKFTREKFKIPEPEAGEELVELPPPPAPVAGPPGAPGAKPKPKVAPNAAEPLSVEAADELVSGVLMDWEPVLVEYRHTIEALGAKADTYDEFLKLLEEFAKTTDSNPFVRQLAISATEARLLASSAEGQEN